MSAMVIKLYPERHNTPITRKAVKSAYEDIAKDMDAHANHWLAFGHQEKAGDLIDAAALVRRVALSIELGD